MSGSHHFAPCTDLANDVVWEAEQAAFRMV
jgi:hypothetical protein